MCARCEELEEEVAYLRSELGLQIDAEALQRLRVVFKRAAVSGPGGQAARFVLALYQTRGRPATHLQLLEATSQDHATDDRRSNIISVWVCHARKVLGKDAIESVWGKGYRLTEAGLERVSAIIGVATASPAIASLHRLDALESLPDTLATGRVG